MPEGSDITSTADLAGEIVGAQQGTTGQALAEDETDASEVRGFSKGADALAAVTTEQVAAAIVDQPFAADAVEKQGGIEIAQEISTDEVYGFPTAPGNPLHDAINEAIGQLIDDGTMDELYQAVLLDRYARGGDQGQLTAATTGPRTLGQQFLRPTRNEEGAPLGAPSRS